MQKCPHCSETEQVNGSPSHLFPILKRITLIIYRFTGVSAIIGKTSQIRKNLAQFSVAKVQSCSDSLRYDTEIFSVMEHKRHKVDSVLSSCCFESLMSITCSFRSHLHQTSASKQSQRCDDAKDTALIENKSHGCATHSGVTQLFSMRVVSLASSLLTLG